MTLEQKPRGPRGKRNANAPINIVVTKIVREWATIELHKGKLQKDVAAELGISPGYLRHILYGPQSFSLEMAEQLLRRCGVSLAEFEKRMEGMS